MQLNEAELKFSYVTGHFTEFTLLRKMRLRDSEQEDLFEDNVSGAFARWRHGLVCLSVHGVLYGLTGLQVTCCINETRVDVESYHLPQSSITRSK